MGKFNDNERRLIFGMSLVTGSRTLGVSMIMPVFSYYAYHLAGSSELMVGIAIGVFGISQAFFQIPMGNLSDRYGRKSTMIFGSLIFLLGIILCGVSKDVYSLTVARFIAGAGAVSGVTMTWVTNGVNERRRNAAMSYIGMCIGIAVILGFPLSWIIVDMWRTSFVFYVCGAFLLVAIIYTILFLEDENIGQEFLSVETPRLAVRDDRYPFSCWKRIKENGNRKGSISHFQHVAGNVHNILAWKNLNGLLGDRDLLRLSAVGFIGSACLSGFFYIMPLLIISETHIDNMWIIFAPVAIIGTMFMFYFANKADKQGTVRIVLIGFCFELIGVIIPVVSHSIYLLIAALIAFYSGHCILSPTLPVAVSRYPNHRLKGTVMSIFTSSQFLGLGIGGVASGFILKASPDYLFGFLIVLTLCSFIIMAGYRDFINK